jgi:hypothetical protein
MYAAAAIPPETSSPAKRAEPAAEQQKPKLLNRLREALRAHHPAGRDRRTEQSHCHWTKRRIFFHHSHAHPRKCSQIIRAKIPGGECAGATQPPPR